MIETLENITLLIQEYQESELIHLEKLNQILKELTANLFYLASERSTAHDKFQKRVHFYTKEKNLSVNKAENEAHVEVPELYQLRYIMKYADNVVMSIQQNISTMKNEKRNQ